MYLYSLIKVQVSFLEIFEFHFFSAIYIYNPIKAVVIHGKSNLYKLTTL